MNPIGIIIIAAYILIELIILLIRLKRKRKRRLQSLKSLYRMLEGRVLDRALKHRMTSAQASAFEKKSPFLYVEILGTKPLLAYWYALDESVTIGKSQGNKICIRDDRLYDYHSKISWLNGTLVIQDMNNRDGVTVKRGPFKKIRVKGNGTVVLKSGDKIVSKYFKIKIMIVYGGQAIR